MGLEIKTRQELVDHRMEEHAIEAFLQLQELGIACMLWPDESRGHFWIWTEGMTEETELHLDYYSLFWGSDELNKILEDVDLYHEWNDAAVSGIYNA